MTEVPKFQPDECYEIKWRDNWRHEHAIYGRMIFEKVENAMMYAQYLANMKDHQNKFLCSEVSVEKKFIIRIKPDVKVD